MPPRGMMQLDMQLASLPTRRAPPQRFALGAINVDMLRKHPACSTPALQECKSLVSYRYDYA